MRTTEAIRQIPGSRARQLSTTLLPSQPPGGDHTVPRGTVLGFGSTFQCNLGHPRPITIYTHPVASYQSRANHCIPFGRTHTPGTVRVCVQHLNRSSLTSNSHRSLVSHHVPVLSSRGVIIIFFFLFSKTSPQAISSSLWAHPSRFFKWSANRASPSFHLNRGSHGRWLVLDVGHYAWIPREASVIS